MDIDLNILMRDVRGLPEHAIAFTANWWLKERLPDAAILQTSDAQFKLPYFAAYGHCSLTERDGLHPDVGTHWDDDTSRVYTSVDSAFLDLQWNGQSFRVLRLSWPEQYCSKTVHWLIGDRLDLLEEFFAVVCAWLPPSEPTVEVFESGFWRPSRTLYQAIKSATFDNLVLAGGLKEEIQTDLSHFFGSKAIYDRYDIPWKRGVIFAGPPGNGKTHAVKALINWLDKTALYVKSLKSRHHTEHATMHSVFDRARTVAPCLLVFEDLESIVTPANRSFFLNELDGFAANAGIVVVATTNHPERLDPALTERPSRFDRKYIFNLPAQSERLAYLAAWNQRIELDLRLTEAGLTRVSTATEGFSFAFLKELIMSSLMRWINLPEKPQMDDVMAGQVEVLRNQMSKSEEPVPSVLLDDAGFEGPDMGYE